MFNAHRTFNLSTGIKGNTICVVNWHMGKNIVVVYHDTIVVGKAGRTVNINDGGFDTVSTRLVINRAMEQIATATCKLFRKKGKTYLNHNGIITEFTGRATIKVRQ